jgi:hypothetical protein
MEAFYRAINDWFFKQHLDDDEQIILILHKHWRIGTKAVAIPTVLFVAVWLILYQVPNKYMFYGVAVAALAILIWWIRNFLDYFLDAWLVTNKGVIDLEWHGWFHRSSTRVLYSDIEGVGYEVKGIFGTLFNYGEMKLEKVSTGGAICMQYVHKPKRAASIIMEAMETYMHTKNLKDAKTVQHILSEFVAGTLQKNAVEAKNKAAFTKKN